MLQPLYLLEIDAAGAVQARKSKHAAWVSAVVVPRALCVFESLPCKGLAWHERGDFARMQARRLAPFAQTGANACIRGGRLMLWFWDHAEVQAAVEPLRLSGHRCRVWAETLLREAPRGSGERQMRCAGGTDHLIVQKDAITESRWQPADTLAAAAPEIARGWPWAWELTGQRLAATPAARSGVSAWTGAQWGQAAAVAVLAGTVGYAAYWGAQTRAAKEHLALLDQRVEQSTQQLGSMSQLRSRAAEAEQWNQSFARLSQSLDWVGLLAALRPVLEKHGVVMKEAEVKGDEARVSLASAGSDIDMPGLLRSLTAVPGFTDVQLRAGLDFSQATFSFRIPGLMRAAGGPERAR